MPVYELETMTGKITIDHEKCIDCESKICVEVCQPKILKIEEGKAVLAIDREEAKKGGCVESLSCELACETRGNRALKIILPIEGLDKLRNG